MKIRKRRVCVPNEKPNDSECNSDWMVKYGELRLEDIADVNTEEKTIMKKWNIHMNRYTVTGIKHMNQVVMEFIDDQKEMIIQENLYRNFVIQRPEEEKVHLEEFGV